MLPKQQFAPGRKLHMGCECLEQNHYKKQNQFKNEALLNIYCKFSKLQCLRKYPFKFQPQKFVNPKSIWV